MQEEAVGRSAGVYSVLGMMLKDLDRGSRDDFKA